MAYDWEGQAEQEGAPKSEPGWHIYTVTGVLRGTRTKTFESRAGDPQILVVFTDEEGLEAAQMFTLSEKAGWALARFVSRAGVDVRKLREDGVEPGDWADEDFAKRKIMHRQVYANCEHEESGGKTYTRLNFAHKDDVPVDVVQRLGQLGPRESGEDDPDGDIPFLFWLPMLLPLLRMIGGAVS